MSKFVRTLLLLCGVALLALLLLLLLFPRERARQTLADQAGAALGQPVRIDGVGLQLLGGIGLRLSGIELGNAAAPDPLHVEVEEIGLRLALAPLLQRRIEITALTIRRPRIEIVAAEESAAAEEAETAGDAARADRETATGASAGANSAATPALPVAVEIRSLEIEDGRVDLRDAGGAPLLHLAGLGEKLAATLENNGDLILAGTTTLDTLAIHTPAGRLGQGLSLRFDKNFRYLKAEDELRIDEATLHLGALPLAVKGAISALTSAAPVAHLALQGGPAEIDQILAFVPAELFPAAAEVRSGGTLQINGTALVPLGAATDDPAAAALDYNLHLLLRDGRIQYGRDHPPLEGILLDLRATPATLQLRQLQAHTAGSRVQASATVTDLQQVPRIGATVDLNLDLAEVAAAAPAAQPFAPAGHAEAELRLRARADALDAAAADGHLLLSGVQATVADLGGPIRDLNAEIDLQRERATLKSLSLAILESDLALTGTLENPLALADSSGGSGRAEFDLRLTSKNLDLDAVFPVDPNKPKGLTPLPPADGRVEFTIGRLVSTKIESRNVRGSARLDHGILKIAPTTLTAFGGRIAAHGDVDLRDVKAPRYEIQADLENVQIGQLTTASPAFAQFGGFGTALQGTLNAKVKAAGALDDTLGIDLQSLVSRSDIEMRNAGIQGHPVQAGLAGFLGTDAVEKLSIPEWTDTFRIENGRLAFSNLKLVADGIGIGAAGEVGMAGELDVKLKLDLPPSAAARIRGKLPAPLAALTGQSNQPMTIPLTLGGSATQPRIGVDDSGAAAVVEEAAAARLAEEKSKLLDQAAGAASSLLGNLTGGEPEAKKGKKEGAKETAPAPTEALEKGIKDLGNELGGLFGKKKKKR